MSTLLASCGGDDATQADKAQTHRRALAADAPTIDATALFGWVETTFPSLFPAGPQNQSLVYEGKTYTLRYYPGTQNYLGVTGSDIFGVGEFTGNALQAFGQLSDWSCQVLGQTCLSGVAASAAAWSGATVEARCGGVGAAVTATTMTASDGSYALAINLANLPCMLRVTGSDGRQLHALAAGAGSGTKSSVQITPMTELGIAYLSGRSPSQVYPSFPDSLPAATSTASARTAGDAVTATINAAGLDFSPVGDLFSAALVPGPGGNLHGQTLAQLAAAMTGGLTQAALTDAITRTTASAKAAGTPSLPVELLLRPAASNCSTLRSGSYRAVTSDVDEPFFLVNFDATTLRFTASDGSSSWTIQADGHCRYKENGGSQYVVSDAGVIASHLEMEGGILRGAVMFPEQTHSLADIAGTWNGLALEDQSADGMGWIHASELTIAGNGQVTGLVYCGKDAGKLASDCLIATTAAQGLPNMAFSVNAAGGFNLTNTTQNYVDRTFLYRSGSGHWMSATGGHLSLGTPRRSRELPSVGLVQAFWNLGVSTGYVANSPLTEGHHTVASVDAAAGTYTRHTLINGSTGATRPERLEVNRFREGFVHRIPEAVAGSDGSAQTVGEFVALPLTGAGLNLVGILGGTQSYVLSILKATAP